ncbi:GNAT family N-acetyltransferase [Guptibacillus sedimenti]|uniref:GNAT family N-acetyltransferase n=1 Tax=Guptibacillus sedimenti TaxID=3025680 RepID=UPI00235F21B6|nr:GNAT family N-acetyltransferase [Pseudalkalibacillus sedimenti]
MNVTKEKITLTKVASHHLTSLKRFTLHEHQLAFTSMPMPAYEICMRDSNRLPVAIMEGVRTVGFFVLDQGDDVFSYTTRPHAILLRAYSINLPDQGRGIAKASLRQLKSFVEKHLPDCREVVLGVNEDNLSAKKVYLEAGFIDTGEQKMGRSGPQAILKFLI